MPILIKARTIALLTAMLSCFLAGTAQMRTDTLKRVYIKGKRVPKISNDDRLNLFSPGQKIKTLDSIILAAYQYQSMAGLLAQQVPVFVKNYGINGLATLNFRGASAAQSQVYWNGIPLQNAATGITDVSSLPVSLIDKVNIVYGSSSALWGSGNVGGAVMIENNPPRFVMEQGLNSSAYLTAGSYGQKQLGVKFDWANDEWNIVAHLAGQTADNEFTYTDNGVKLKMQNAGMYSGTAIVNAAYKADAYNTISLSGWAQNYYRQIPRALFESTSEKDQRNISDRLALDWKYERNNTMYYAKAAFIQDKMKYRDSVILLESDMQSKSSYAELGGRYKFNNGYKLQVFMPLQLAWIDTKAGAKWQEKWALAAALAGSYFMNRLNVSLNMRGEIVNDNSMLLPGINASLVIFNWLSVRANLQRTYRVPTLNEQYYVPGGNDKLRPEQGWNKDIGYVVKTRLTESLSLQHDLSYFNRNIKDWIIWFGGAIWTPHNIAMVHSRGLETENSLLWNLGKYKIHAGLNTLYVLATTEKSDLPNDGSIGKQIPYSPRYNGQLNLGFSYRGLYLNYNQTYTGYRFITTDESQYLLPYSTSNFQLLYQFLVKKVSLQATIQVNNIANNNYQVVSARPMPGTNWLAGIKLGWK